ncbi:MAG: stage II sporulation protein P [Lachnospiraceae bacterium]|nr:stage II sporulation protein P [Lachnospiraceae bacterium]
MNISHKVKRQGILIIVFLLILVHLLMRAVYDIENSMENNGSLGEKLYSAALKQGISISNPYLLYANGNEKSGIQYQFYKNMPLEMCLMREMEDTDPITEYRQPSVIEEMAAVENSLAYQNKIGNDIETESHSDNLTDNNNGLELEQAVLAENTAAAGAFVPVQAPVAKYSLQQLRDPGFIKKTFYSEDPTTQIKTDQLQYDTLMGFDASLKQDNSNVQILVYHTHSQETYIDSVPGDSSTSIVGVGEHLCDILRTQYGFNVLHHTGEYDVESRDNAYSNAMVGLDKVLAENPTIEVMIDLHRDQTNPNTKLVTTIQDRPTARFMFFNGLCYTKSLGTLSNLPNPYVQDNLSFSFQMQLAAEEYYPGLTRRIYLKGYRYNLHYKPKSLLIELGSQTNTVEEAMNACDPMAHIIAMILNGENKE